jgi:hypothetical protein
MQCCDPEGNHLCITYFNDACVQSSVPSDEFFSTVTMNCNFGVAGRPLELGGI